MGLSGRKTKQKIGADPRNLSWADDASKFGQSYLSKFGWDASQGLGASGDGRTTYIKVQQKLDMFGIGSQHQKDPNGTAWQQNKDFENVLRKLNATMGSAGADIESEMKEVLGGAFISATESKDEEVSDGKKETKDKKKDKKRKRNGDDTDDNAAKKTKPEPEPPAIVPAAQKEKVLPRHRAHRARHIAAKNRAFNSAAAMDEILGISSSSATPQSTPSASMTPTTSEDTPNTLEKITISSKSVADYFKERLLAKSGATSSSPLSASADDTAAPSRGGIGSGSFGIQDNETRDDAPRMGLGMSKFGSLMSSAFLTAASSATFPDAEPADGDDSNEPAEEDEAEVLKSDKKKRKREEKERRKDASGGADGNLAEQKLAKEERRRLKAEKRKRKEEKALALGT